MKHWGCTKCHHEWDGSSPQCTWCGATGEILAETASIGYVKLLKDFVKKKEG